jgi:radical SAM family uncharacterized protein/radical SAM-linked protein
MDFRQQLLKILPTVRHPSRYIGCEWGQIVKDPKSVAVKIVLAFPDAYEIGMSYPGFQILYHILNRRRDVLCERVYAPFPDMENALRDKQLSLFSLESFRPLHQFDIIGFTLQYELHATNILTMLDLGAIPLWAEQRTDNHPLVIAGGPGAFNPEPLAPFLDAVVLGDGEEIVHSIVDIVIDAKKRKADRESLLASLAKLPGVYVPQFYHPQYQGNRFSGISVDNDFPLPVTAVYAKQLKDDYYSQQPLVPVSEVSHNRLPVEIMRGCTRGCRFCQAGMIHRPLRERSVSSICHQVSESLDNTGYEEISLVSLSTSDYCDLNTLLDELEAITQPRQVSLSFPSLRPDTFTESMAKRAAAGRTNSITFVPEAGTPRLRAVINKAGDETDVYRACEIALANGFRNFKLYFMIGLPTETDDDLVGIAEMVKGIFRFPGSYQLQGLTLSISPFVPKPHTPFQRLPQITGEALYQKMDFLKSILPRRKVKIDRRSPKVAEIEGILTRGDRRLAKVIHRVWRQGARFCGWSDHFRFDLYQHALAQEGLSSQWFLNGFPSESPLPWGHLSKGINPNFLEQEFQKSLIAETTTDCRNKCQRCGLPPQDCIRPTGFQPMDFHAQDAPGTQNRPTDFQPVDDQCKKTIRIKYAIRDLLQFLSHLETVHIWERIFRRSGLPIQFTEGYRARPRLSFSPPRPVGVASEAEYLDIRLNSLPIEHIQQKLSEILPYDIEILSIGVVKDDSQSLDSTISQWDYLVKFENHIIDLTDRCQSLLNQEHIPITRTKKAKFKNSKLEKVVDIRPSIIELTPNDQTLKIVIAKTASIATIPEILDALGLSGLQSETIRTHQWIHQNDRYLDPIEICNTGKENT